MRLVSFFRNLSLTAKVNLVVLLGGGISLVMIFFIISGAIGRLVDQTSSQRLDEEAASIQHRFEEMTDTLLQDADLISRDPQLFDQITQAQRDWLQTFVRVQGGLHDLDAVYIVDTEKTILASLNAEGTVSSAQNDLFTLALIGIQTTGTIENQADSGPVLQMAAVAPIRDLTGQLIGGILVARDLDDDLLAAVNYQRTGIDLALVFDNTVRAQSAGSFQYKAGNPLTVENDLDRARVEQAATGRQMIQGDTSYNADHDPYRAVYVPFEVGERSVPLVMVISISEKKLLDFESGLRQGLLVAILFVGGAELVGFTVLLRWSVIRPLRRLAAIVHAMAKGQYSRRADESSTDEIGRLGYAFNRMAQAIEQREKALEDLNASLEHQVEERTADLRQQAESLRIASVRAKEAARVKSEFLANMSHELRTPLNAIIGFSDMLLMGIGGTLADKQRHKVERLRENGTRLLTLVNDILDLTRIEAKRIEIVYKPFSPHTLVERLTKQMEPLAEKKHLTFHTFLDPDLPETLLGDEPRVEQIVVNLLSNAFKFTDKGSVTLEVRINRADRQWSVSVADTGIGIPLHSHDVIFEEFRQVDGSSSRAYQGSGLGLAITNNLVRIMNGHIELKSEVGKGSTFTVTLPLVELADPAEALDERVSLPEGVGLG